MSIQFNAERFIAAGRAVRTQLLDQRCPAGHWDCELPSSPLATATAISAVVLAEQHGGSGVIGLKRHYGQDKTFVVPILTNCALADLLPWRQVPTLPFELVCLPPSWYRPFNLQVVRYAIPVLVALGQARHYHAPSRNPVVRSIRQAARKRSLAILETMQPESGGFLEATPLTAFVVMSLSSIGLAEHAIVRKGVEFLLTSVRADGSWPMDTNLTVKDTAQAVTALRWDLSKRVPAPKDVPTNAPPPLEKADPSEKLHGSVEETALAIEALIALHDQQASPEDRVNSAMEKGIFWLTEAILEGRYDDPSPIGSYFAKLWYHERLCPRIIAVQTLDRAAKHLGLMLDGQTPTTHRQAATTR